MLLDGLTITASGTANGIKPKSGTAFPSNPLDGEGFRLTATVGQNPPGLYWYDAAATAWNATGDILAVLAGAGLSGGGTDGSLTLSVDFPTLDARYVGKAGGTMTDLLVLSGDPGQPLGAATKQYTDAGDAAATAIANAALPKAGGTMLGNLLLNADPTQAFGAATKQYVDAVAQGLDPKASVRVATTGNITLSGLQTIDGVAAIAGDRVLVMAQTTGSQNGVYVASAGAWARAVDADTSAKVTPGMYTFVEEGTTRAATGWNLLTKNVVLGTTALVFGQFGAATSYTAGTGISIAGNSISGAYTAGLGITITGASIASTLYDIAGSILSKPTASAVVATFVAPRAFTLAANLTGSKAKCTTTATASYTMSVQKNAVQIGTIVFASGATSATFTGSLTSFAVDDVLTVVAPASADATFNNCAFTLAATLA